MSERVTIGKCQNLSTSMYKVMNSFAKYSLDMLGTDHLDETFDVQLYQNDLKVFNMIKLLNH